MLWLIGMMGSGKTSVGVEVAARRGVDFIDTDELVTAVTDLTIPEIWEHRGEEEFRRLERQMIASAASGDEPVVIGTGGGAVLADDNVEVMRRSGTVVWLAAAPETLARRIGRDSNRPLLAEAEDPVEVLRRVLAEREARYRRAAHAVVTTDDKTIDEVVEEVLGLWNGS
ncbi:MAG: shikimate kinase [Actinomycetes bacterium]|jgi:shikimate kinase|nr:shikimate kinase [Acidimicrobiia bacterium]